MEVGRLTSPATADQVDALLRGELELDNSTMGRPPFPAAPIKPTPFTPEPDSSFQVSSDDTVDDDSATHSARKKIFMETMPAKLKWSEKRLWSEAITLPAMEPQELWLRVVGYELPSATEAREFQLVVNAIRTSYNRALKSVSRRTLAMRLPD
jgi:hypothetical protein